MNITHPCVFSDEIIQALAGLIPPNTYILDPFAGTGKIAKIRDWGWQGDITCNEIQREYLELCKYDVDKWIFGDAEDISKDLRFDGIVTSPTYGNRMADHWKPKDTSKRISYTFCLGKPLKEANTGRMQWGEAYRTKHDRIYRHLSQLVKPGGFFLLNISNHIRNKSEIDVKQWHIAMLESLGWKLCDTIPIRTHRMRYGRNQEKRVDYEYILKFEK